MRGGGWVADSLLCTVVPECHVCVWKGSKDEVYNVIHVKSPDRAVSLT